jgi:beta-mannosidase
MRSILMIKLDPPPRNHARIESSIQGKDALVSIEVEIKNSSSDPMAVKIDATVRGENLESADFHVMREAMLFPGTNFTTLEIPVANAQLWWPWDMGEQNLYRAELAVVCGDAAQDRLTEVFGIREIKVEMNPGYTPDEAEFPWTFMVNGKRHFLRSSCWGGPPSMLYGRNTDAKYELRLDMVKEANINNLRIFGWHPPEVPYFYELCDRLGITVWTNFSFATQGYKARPDVLGPAVVECMEIVKQRRNHPSAIFWMGGEEVSFSGAHVENDNKLFMEKSAKAWQRSPTCRTESPRP